VETPPRMKKSGTELLKRLFSVTHLLFSLRLKMAQIQLTLERIILEQYLLDQSTIKAVIARSQDV